MSLLVLLTATATVGVPALSAQDSPPSLQQLPDQFTPEGDPVSIQIIGSDPDVGDEIRFSAAGLPPGLTINSITGLITGTTSPNSAGGGWGVTILIRNPGGPVSDSMSFVLNITSPDGPAPTTTQAPTTTTTQAPTTTRAPRTTTTAVSVVTPATSAAPTTSTSSTATSTIPDSSSTTSAPTTSTSAPVEESSTSSIPHIDLPEESDSNVPEVESVSVLRAADDLFAAGGSSVTLFDVLVNDEGGSGLRVVLVTQPELGSVEVADGGLIEVSFPESFAGSIEFEYEVTDDSGAVSRAVVVVESSNVLEPVQDLLTIGDDSPGSLGELGSRAETIYAELIQVRLSGVQLSALSIAPLLLGLLYWALRDRDHLVSVTSASVGDGISATMRADGKVVKLRHDGLLFARNRTRRRDGVRERLVTLRAGQTAWVDASEIVDTGY